MSPRWRKIAPWLVLVFVAWGGYFTIELYGGPERVPSTVKAVLAIALLATLFLMRTMERRLR